MKYQFKSLLLVVSLVMNVFVALPAFVVFTASSTLQYDLYQEHLASQFGRPEIVFLGDSITAGGRIWAFRIGEYNLNVWNYGHGGLTTKQIILWAEKVANQRKTRYAFVMAGINDPDKTIAGAEKSFADYKQIIDTLLEGGVTPIIQLTLYRENEPSPQFVDHLNELLVEYSRQHHLTVIDLNPVLAPCRSLLRKYSVDGIHINEAAYDIWGDQAKSVLQKLRAEQSTLQSTTAGSPMNVTRRLTTKKEI